VNQLELKTPNPQQNWALFLDIDGTLIDIAARPDAVIVPKTLARILAVAGQWLGSALAIVSGRTLAIIDEMMAPLVLSCAGEHGAVIRLPDGTIWRAGAEYAVPDAWKARLQAVAKDWNGVIVEIKPYSVSIHFRQAPARGGDVRVLVEDVVTANTRDFEVLAAHMAFEIRHRALNKAAAVHELMKHTPFRERIPVFVGDDVTDEDGFRAAQEMGGLALRVADSFGGRPSNVHRWLESFRSSNTG